MNSLNDIKIDQIQNIASIQSIIDFNSNFNPKDLKNMEVFSETKRIEALYQNARRSFFDIQYQLSNPDNLWVSNNEFEEFEKKLSLEMTIKEYISVINSFPDYLKELRCNQFTRLFEFKIEAELDDYFLRRHFLMCRYLKKMVMDEICKNYGRRLNSWSTKFIEYKREFPEKNKNSFIYVSTDPIEIILFNKLNLLITPDGDKVKIVNVLQKTEPYILKVDSEERSVRLKLPVYYGVICCELEKR